MLIKSEIKDTPVMVTIAKVWRRLEDCGWP